MAPINVLIMIHGMIPQEHPHSPFEDYREFWQALTVKEPRLPMLFPDDYIGVEWGHEPHIRPEPLVANLHDDQKLTRAQNFVNQRVSYNQLVKVSDPNNLTLSLLGSGGFDFPLLTPLIRALALGLRETIITRGFGDVIYYCSEEGEKQVRCRVYGQALKQLDHYLPEPEVRLHLIGQSLGVTLTYDFLYGLFAPPPYKPGFYEQGNSDDVQRYDRWRQKAQNRELKLGSLTSTASQLPLFVMRKQKLVDSLAMYELIDANNIGLTNSGPVKWQIFYDVDDLLGFGTRRLYNADKTIREFQVDSGDNPGDAHINYWKNSTVIEETAKLLLENAS